MSKIAHILGRKRVRCPCSLYPSREAGRGGTPLHPSSATSTWGHCRDSLPGQHVEPAGCSGGRWSRLSKPDPRMAVLSVAGDSLRSVTVRGGHEMFSVHRVPPAFASGPRGGGGSARGVWMCARGAVLLRTRLQMQPCTVIFRHPFSQQCRLKIQLRLLIGIFITILSAAPA